MKTKTINEHYDKQMSDVQSIAKNKNKPVTVILRSKHHYMNRVVKLYWLSLYAIKYNDGTDKRLHDRSIWRKKFYIQKLLSL